MITSKIRYLGNLRTSCTHIRSGNQFITDAPVDNNGKGEAFSPTDTVATALASCMITTMAIRCEKQGLNIEGAEAEVAKIMAAGPRRISEIHVNLQIPDHGLSTEDKDMLESTARNCPVAKSLHPDIEQVLAIRFKKS